MYFNSKIHILSTALFVVAMVNTLAEGAAGGIRLLMRRIPSLLPDMMNSFVGRVDAIAAFVRIIVAIIVFYFAWKKLNRYKRLVDLDDHEEMGRLQSEFLKDNKSALTVAEIEQLLRVWAVILIGVEMVYDITAEGYTRFIEQLSSLINYNDAVAVELFASMYNSTHGFKYIGMLIAILMGVIVTGIFLDDKYLVIASGISTVVFLIAFFLVQMDTVTIFNRAVGIVWTSVIFHAMQTVGILAFSIYIRHRYMGL